MGNDPRPHYFHQTNLMSQTTGPATSVGNGLYYETMNPLLWPSTTQYFAADAPIVQLTMGQIGTLLTEQAGWAASSGNVTGSIEGNTVTVNNGTGGQLEIPLTGTTVGSAYAGSQSGWVLAPAGTSTYTALAAWPAPPVIPPKITPPTGPAPSTHGKPPVTGTTKPVVKPTQPVKPIVAKPQPRVVVQVAPKTVRVKHGAKVTVSLKCIAAKGQFCTGSFKLSPMGQSVSHKFRIKASKVSRITVKLPKRARLRRPNSRRPDRQVRKGRQAASHAPREAGDQDQPDQRRRARITRGMLNVRI